MDILVKNNYLYADGKTYQCAIGANGISSNKKEGDLKTPAGTYYFTKIFYREDRVGKLNLLIDTEKIRETDGWCDDVNSASYNQHIRFPFKESAEKLFRDDDLYDIICVINYNSSPIIKSSGSAIFLHVAKEDYSSTEGCIALKKEDLMEVINKITYETRITIRD